MRDVYSLGFRLSILRVPNMVMNSIFVVLCSCSVEVVLDSQAWLRSRGKSVMCSNFHPTDKDEKILSVASDI